MNSFQLMCDDLEMARISREQVKAGLGRDYFDQQARCAAQWMPGEPPPEGLVLGELPYLHTKGIRAGADNE